MQENDLDLPDLPDELTTLKARADLLGISYHPSIGLEKMREKLAAALSDDENNTVIDIGDSAPAKDETLQERRTRKRREANELVRIRVTCMNPFKKEWEGEIITAGNATVGTFKKYVPFNIDEGWHVPRIIYNQLIQRQCQVFVTMRDGRGNNVRSGKLIREFAIEVLPQLTAEELQDLAQRQAMARSID